jgi:hypothetical protein
MVMPAIAPGERGLLPPLSLEEEEEELVPLLARGVVVEVDVTPST